MSNNKIRFELGSHSANKDHTVMTGGTLNIDKKVISSKPLVIRHYLLPGVRITQAHSHPGIHSLEHMLAYSVDTGSLRAQIARLNGNENMAKSILDISPYTLEEKNIGFRLSSIALINKKMLTEAYIRSLEIGKKYLLKGGKPPFATAEQCGQYDFHSIEGALEAIISAQRQLRDGTQVEEFVFPESNASKYVVYDLRLIRPKVFGVHDQRMLNPSSSHSISQTLEHFVHNALPEGKLGDIRFGTFGCMTGDYVIANGTYTTKEVHIAITRGLMTLKQIPNNTKSHVNEDVKFCLEHIEKFSPQIYRQAQDLGVIIEITG